MATTWTEAEVTAAQDTRRQRAESSEFEFTIIDGRDIVTNPATQKSYIVDGDNCTCPDFVYRCSKSGLLCKHGTALRLHKLEMGQ